MDMYQKREMRKNKKMEQNTKSLPSASINREITTYGKLLYKKKIYVIINYERV